VVHNTIIRQSLALKSLGYKLMGAFGIEGRDVDWEVYMDGKDLFIKCTKIIAVQWARRSSSRSRPKE
jgi:hypothetical protein